VLKGAVLIGALPALGFTTVRRAGVLLADPFTLGVASGEPAPDGAVIWTRLAPRPLAEDGRGGMPDQAFDVEWEIADDHGFGRVVQRGMAVARPENAHSVHVELTGLAPAAEYFYRFRVAGFLSPAGRTHTAPQPNSVPAQLTICAVSCANYEDGWFTAYRGVAEEQPDLVVELGDFIYEDGRGRRGAPVVRRHVGAEPAMTLADYRLRYAQYRTDPDLQAAQAVAVQKLAGKTAHDTVDLAPVQCQQQAVDGGFLKAHPRTGVARAQQRQGAWKQAAHHHRRGTDAQQRCRTGDDCGGDRISPATHAAGCFHLRWRRAESRIASSPTRAFARQPRR
jgi:hypothetical protein